MRIKEFFKNLGFRFQKSLQNISLISRNDCMLRVMIFRIHKSAARADFFIKIA